MPDGCGGCIVDCMSTALSPLSMFDGMIERKTLVCFHSGMVGDPFTQQKWDNFLSMSPWFANNKNFLRDQMDIFRATGKLAVATYALGQSADKVGPDTTPWLFTGMFCQRTVQPVRDGLPGQNTVWTDAFRSLQSRQQ